MRNYILKLWILALSMFIIIIFSLFWLATASFENITFFLAFAAGLSMIFLPCTLPLVFVIIPLSMRKDKKKGFLMSLCFGLGLVVTLTIYGAIVALIGRWLGLDQITRAMFIIAGIFAYIFGISQLKLIHSVVLSFWQIPKFVHKKTDYLKSFLMGFFLGNAGVGCPNPAFYVLLVYIAATGSLTVGAKLGAVHGFGRAVPIIFLSILAVLGINSIKFISSRTEIIHKITGWGLLIVGVYIFSTGFFGMYFWESSIVHQSWNAFVGKHAPRLAETTAAAEYFNISVKPSTIEQFWPSFPWITMLVFLILPAIWRHYRKITLSLSLFLPFLVKAHGIKIEDFGEAKLGFEGIWRLFFLGVVFLLLVYAILKERKRALKFKLKK